MTEITHHPSQPIELGARIETSRKLIKDLAYYNLSQSEQNIIIGYVRNGQDFNLIIPTCPDYLPDSLISSKDDPIIGSQVPGMLFPLLETANKFCSILYKNDLPVQLQVLISNPRYGGLELSQMENQNEFIYRSYKSQKEKIADLLISEYPQLQFEVKDFGEEFGYSAVSSLEEKYINILGFYYREIISFKETVQRKIKADNLKIRTDYDRFVKVNKRISYEDFAVRKIIRGMAESLAFGDLIAKTKQNLIVCSPAKRDNMANQRNKIKLPEYGRTEQITIPIISPNK